MTVQPPEAGPSWTERAALGELAAVLDPQAGALAKNAWIDSRQRRCLSAALGHVPGSLILDLGCGTGRMSRWLTTRGAVVVGLDPTRAMLAAAAECAGDVTYVQADGRLPLQTGSISSVVIVLVLQYMVKTEVAGQTLAEAHRVLKPGGRIVVLEQVGSNLGRGGLLEEYLDAIRGAGFINVVARPVRAADSRVGSIAARLPPWLARTAGLLPVLARSLRLSSAYSEWCIAGTR